MSSYTLPVDKLLTYSTVEADKPFEKVNYAETFGIGPEHIPELIRMAKDEELVREEASDYEFTAPLHTLQALGQLHAEEAIQPLLELFDTATKNDNEWMAEMLPEFYAMIGPVALPALITALAETPRGYFSRSYIASAITAIAQKHPESRLACIEALSHALETVQDEDDEEHAQLRGSIISDLIQLHAVEATPTIEKVLAEKDVDPFFCGDWDEVQYELGLKERPPRQEHASLLDPFARPSNYRPITADDIKIVRTPIPTPTSSKPKGSSKKAKAKMAKASQKRNRRKK